MGGDWFTQPGETGVVTITNREGDWFMTKPATDTQTKCMLQGDFDASPGSATQRLEITVSKFMYAAGQGPNYLFAVSNSTSSKSTGTSSDSGNSTTRTKKPTHNNNTSRSTTKNTEGPEKRSLSKLSGSGDYVTVEAIVDDVFWVEKDKPNVPDIIGVLREEGTGEKRIFLVDEGVKHPYLEEGRKFVFQNAKDHYYRREDEVQLLITQYTNFTDKGLVQNSSKVKSKPSRKKRSSGKSLDQIARTMLGGKEFKMKQQDKDSAIGKAKKQARRQQRDPAIDPKLKKGR